jgi:hypothetical protein
MLDSGPRFGQTDVMVANGRPEITETGARVRANGNGPGYRPPSAKDGFPRFGGDSTELICDPYARQDLMASADEDGDFD